MVVEEGEEEGVSVREELGVPGEIGARRSHFHNEEKRKEWEFEVGRVYFADFGNQYLDFNGQIAPLYFFIFFPPDCVFLLLFLYLPKC